MVEEFDKDLDEYLSERHKTSFLKGVFGKKKKEDPIELNPMIETYDEDKAPPKEEPKPVGPPEVEIVEAEKGLIGKFISKVKEIATPEPEEYVEVVTPASEDMKEVAKIALEAIKLLPPEELGRFKRSPTFARLKEILHKHKLIK